jgi:LPS-assembly lipoprotein
MLYPSYCVKARKLMLASTLTLLLFLLAGCGFHLRGSFSIPKPLHILQISPDQPYDPFQRALRNILKRNNVQVLDPNHPQIKEASTLFILNQIFSERILAYRTDGQAIRSILDLTIPYQAMDSKGKMLISNVVVRVRRELTINPDAVLGTDYERARLKNELYVDAASMLTRQLEALGNTL